MGMRPIKRKFEKLFLTRPLKRNLQKRRKVIHKNCEIIAQLSKKD